MSHALTEEGPSEPSSFRILKRTPLSQDSRDEKIDILFRSYSILRKILI
jgi:hypothetical protein